ncbi:MAG TPA: L-threonylcarbamoyladenylate synthase [Methylomirabilota bacterium]|nr:L-threonylcarbamoyladenylate synthase [Methylomirabilota bacterium]
MKSPPGRVADIQRAADVLRAGGLVAFPTETVYGLGADAENHDAVARIFDVKGRPRSHPLIIHIRTSSQLREWADDVSAAAQLLSERFWPGPLTLVLRRGRRVSLVATGGGETVALRVPAHAVALELLGAFGGGIAAPSANRFGSVSPTRAAHVRDELGTAVDFVLDGGPCEVGIESTIVDVTGEGAVILRPGGVTREELEDVLGRTVQVGSRSPVRAPGQHALHYAPRARVMLVEPHDLVREAIRLAARGERVGVLLPGGTARVPGNVSMLVVPDSMMEYAHQLYDMLRELDRRGCNVIVASLPAEDRLGLAIADRLRRAAGPRGREAGREEVPQSGDDGRSLNW